LILKICIGENLWHTEQNLQQEKLILPYSSEQSGKLFVFGGGEGQSYFDHLYVLDTNSMCWSKPECTGNIPGPRRAHSAVLAGKKMFVFGGGDGKIALNQTYILDIEKMSWDLLKTSGTLPSARGYHTANLLDDKMVIIGGSDGQECFSDIFSLDIANATWTKKKTDPLACFCHSTTTMNNRTLLSFGGHDGKSHSSDLRTITIDSRADFVEVSKKTCTGVSPVARGYHTSTLFDSRLFVMGGYDGSTCFSDTRILDLGIYAHLK